METATYCSEFVAAKTATEQIMDLRYTLRYLGIPVKLKSYMFGNNSATLPHSTLSKRHNILAFHRVREAIAGKIIDFHWMQSEYNLSDMLSMHWEHIKIFPMIQELLITCGPITLIPMSATEETPKSWVIHTTLKISIIQTTHNSTYYISFIIHVSPRTCHIHHKRGVTEVCHTAHFWGSHGRCGMPGIPMRQLVGLSRS